MSKVLSAVFGIGIAVVVYTVLLLGIQAFYPAPRYNDFCNETVRFSDPMMSFVKCPDNITVGECRTTMETEGDEMQECNKAFEDADMIYSRNFFIIASTLGVLTIIAAFFLLGTTNISAGIACSGIILIMFAFIRGWMSTNDKLKFFVGLVAAAVVITLAVLVNRQLAHPTRR